MKKILYLAAIVAASFSLYSCDDHADIPDVDFNVSISGGVFDNNTIYVVRGNTLSIDNVQVVNNESGKGVTLPYVNYYLNHQFMGQNSEEPYGFEITFPESMILGKYVLEITAPVFAVDKEPGYAVLTYNIKLVESADDVPSGGVQNFVSTPSVTEAD